MKLSVVVLHKKVGDLLTALGWFAHLRHQFGRAFLWENIVEHQAYVGAEPICVVQRRGEELVLTDFITHKSDFMRHDVVESAENQLKQWLQSYETTDAEGLTWVGCSGEVTTAMDSFYYQLYRYNFYFDQQAGTLRLIEYVAEGAKSNILALWANFMPSSAWDLATFEAKGAWQSMVTDAQFDTQLKNIYGACGQNSAYVMTATRACLLAYQGDILQFYRAMRKETANVSQYFFMEAGHFQWFGQDKEAIYNTSAFAQRLFEEGQMNDNLLQKSLLCLPSSLRIGVPILQALSSLKSMKVAIAALLVGFIKNGEIQKQMPMRRLFTTQQGNTLCAYAQTSIDINSRLATVHNHIATQIANIEQISAMAEYF